MEDQGGWVGGVLHIWGGARAFQVERTSQAGAHLVCAGSRGPLGSAGARYVAGGWSHRLERPVGLAGVRVGRGGGLEGQPGGSH